MLGLHVTDFLSALKAHLGASRPTVTSRKDNTRAGRALCWSIASLGAVACAEPASEPGSATSGSSTGGRPAAVDPPVGDTSSGRDDTSGSSSSDAPNPTWIFDVNAVPDGGAPICDTLQFDAEPRPVPTDLVVVVDGSGSMVEEASEVEARLGEVVAGLQAETIDTRVVLLARATGSTGICISAPVGSGLCPSGSNEPSFRHLDVDVGSWESLQVIVDQFPNYADLLRPGARRQLVVVSDDNSFDLSADDFETGFSALDVWNDGFVFHAIVSETACPEIVSEGVEYMSLAERTGGSLGDLCRSDFAALFEGLTAGTVNASAGCAYPLDPDSDWFSEPQLVTIQADGVTLENLRVPEDCAQSKQGWFLDDPVDPTTLHLCPASCARVQVLESPILDISVTCETVES